MDKKYVLQWFSHIVLNIQNKTIKTLFRKFETVNKKPINLPLHLEFIIKFVIKKICCLTILVSIYIYIYHNDKVHCIAYVVHIGIVYVVPKGVNILILFSEKVSLDTQDLTK